LSLSRFLINGLTTFYQYMNEILMVCFSYSRLKLDPLPPAITVNILEVKSPHARSCCSHRQTLLIHPVFVRSQSVVSAHQAQSVITLGYHPTSDQFALFLSKSLDDPPETARLSKLEVPPKPVITQQPSVLAPYSQMQTDEGSSFLPSVESPGE